MEGMHMGGVPWIDSMGPVTLHAWREYECSFNDTSKCQYQQGYWRFWYEADHRYALPTVAFFTVAVILFAIGHLLDLTLPSRRSGLIGKATAATRFLTYRAWRFKALNWNTASLGVLALGAVGTIYFFCMTLAPKPYYWPDNADGSWGGSPPIATRAGWLSLACMPFVFATAGKSNFITAVTGVSHEKLQVFHRWISYAFFVTALIHTFPFIVFNVQTGTMEMNWNTTVFYWTGVIALIAQAYLTFASISPLRNMSYEWFKFSHFLAALIFVLFLFFHCDYTLSSWDYFIATGVLFALSWLHRQLRVYFEHGIGHRASISLTPNGFVRVSIPTHARWQAGQHFFVRFMTLGIHAWSIHPFTACSLPAPATELERTQSELVLYIRPRGGFTARLARLAESRPETSIRVLLDGPYGGVDMRKIEQSQRHLVIAGGSGAGWVLPMIAAFLRKQQQRRQRGEKDDAGPAAGETMRVVLATRDPATSQWFEEAVRQTIASESNDGSQHHPAVEIEVFYTGSSGEGKPKSEGQFLQKLAHPEDAAAAADIKHPTTTIVDTISKASRSGSDSDDTASSTATPSSFKHYSCRRPDLPSLVREAAAATRADEQLGVVLCGPLGMQHDVQNAVADEQVRILKGAAGGMAGQVYLHMEHFTWA